MPLMPTTRTREVQASSHLDAQAGDPPTGTTHLRSPGTVANHRLALDPLMTAEDVARRLRVSTDWVWDHSSRKKPLLPVIRMGDGTLRYRSSAIELFIDDHERLSAIRRRAV